MAVTHPAPQDSDVLTGQPQPDRMPEQTSPGAAFGRLTWMLLGPFALFLSALALVGRGFLSFASVAYLAILGAMLLGRWVEFRSGGARTADGRPATPGHLRRYLFWTTIIGLTIWVAAGLIRNVTAAG
jgi:hypothetical protein